MVLDNREEFFEFSILRPIILFSSLPLGIFCLPYFPVLRLRFDLLRDTSGNNRSTTEGQPYGRSARETDDYQGAEGAPALTISGPNLGPNVDRRK